MCERVVQLRQRDSLDSTEGAGLKHWQLAFDGELEVTAAKV